MKRSAGCCRECRASSDHDPTSQASPAAPDRAGDASNTDAYVELRVPVLKDQPGAQLLELGLGYRYSDYSQVGGVSSYKAELLYRPVNPLRLRGSYQHAVRAPSIEELYYPPVSNQFIVPMPEPCDANSPARTGPDRAQVEALCLAQGVPAALLPTTISSCAGSTASRAAIRTSSRSRRTPTPLASP